MDYKYKTCSYGQILPASFPCPPPFSAPNYYDYQVDGNIPSPPAGDGGGGGGISAGAVAGILSLVGFFLVMGCLCAIKFRRRLFFSRQSEGNAGDMERQAGAAGGADDGARLLPDQAGGGGLGEKLVSLLPVFEYARHEGMLYGAAGQARMLKEAAQQEYMAAGDVKGEEAGRRRHSTTLSGCAGGSLYSCCECAVCLSPFEEKERVRILPYCKHVFHVACIDKWFEAHSNCPLCRHRITLHTIQLFFRGASLVIDQPAQQFHEDDHHGRSSADHRAINNIHGADAARNDVVDDSPATMDDRIRQQYVLPAPADRPPTHAIGRHPPIAFALPAHGHRRPRRPLSLPASPRRRHDGNAYHPPKLIIINAEDNSTLHRHSHPLVLADLDLSPIYGSGQLLYHHHPSFSFPAEDIQLTEVAAQSHNVRESPYTVESQINPQASARPALSLKSSPSSPSLFAYPHKMSSRFPSPSSDPEYPTKNPIPDTSIRTFPALHKSLSTGSLRMHRDPLFGSQGFVH